MSTNPFDKYLDASVRQELNMANKGMAVTNPRFDTTLGAVYAGLDKPVVPAEYKTLGDVVGDAGVDVAKFAITLGSLPASTVDLGAFALGGLGSSAWEALHAIAPNQVPTPIWNEYGMVSKGLNDAVGYNPTQAKQALGDALYSDVRKKQEAEVHTGYTEKQIQDFKDSWSNQYDTGVASLIQSGASEAQVKDYTDKFNVQYRNAYTDFMNKNQMSWDKSAGENLSILGHTFGKVLDHPSVGVGTAIDSMGYILPSIALSRGVLALEKAVKTARLGEGAIGPITAGSPFAAAGIAEGGVSTLALAEQMRNNSPTGTIDGTKVAAAIGGGGLTGLIGVAGARMGQRFGLHDVDTAGLNIAATPSKIPALTRPIASGVHESGEEFLQGIGETILPNIAEGKDPYQGLNQELALGAFAGGVTSATFNAGTILDATKQDITSLKDKAKDAITIKDFATLNDPNSKHYDPVKAFNSQVPNLNSDNGDVKAEANANAGKVLETLSARMGETEARLQDVVTAISQLPKDPKTLTDEQKIAGQELFNEYRALSEQKQANDTHYTNLMTAINDLDKHKETVQGQQFTDEQAKADIAALASVDTPVDQANQAVERVTKHFSKFNADELASLASSPFLSEAQRGSLRQLSEAKRKLADMQSTSQVADNIINGYKGKTARESHRGLADYTSLVNTALSTRNPKMLATVLGDLGSFTQSHLDKAKAVNEAMKLVQEGKHNVVQVLRTADGIWGLNVDTASMLPVGKLKKAGGLNIHENSDKATKDNPVGVVQQINNEAKLLQTHLNALTGIAQSFIVPVAPSTSNDTLTSQTDPVEPETSAPLVTWDNIQAGQSITLYRGESADNTKNGNWWTTNKAKAEKFGKVTSVVLPAEVIGKHATRGHGGADEFYFPNKKPGELAALAQSTNTSVPDTSATQTPASTDTGKQIAKGMDGIVKSIPQASHNKAVERFKRDGQIVFVKPEAIAAVQQDPRYEATLNADGYAVVTNIQDSNGNWVKQAAPTQVTQEQSHVQNEVETKRESKPLSTDEPTKLFKLNGGQQKAFDAIMRFLDSDKTTFTLSGSAGTGKTTLVNSIITALKEAGSVYANVVLSAPTHRANAVTKSKNPSQEVVTLHQLLSLAPEVDLENFDASKVKFKELEKEEDPFPTSGLIIVDESSMISDGLYDLLMAKVAKFPGVKILFLGDAAQLKPVLKNNVSSLKDSKALTETEGRANLTKVERAKNPELLDESSNLRASGVFTYHNNMHQSNGVAFINDEEGFIGRLIRMYKSQAFADNRLLVRAVAFTNKRVTELNAKVRQALFGHGSPDYVVGDLLMGYNRFGQEDEEGNLPIANGIDYLVTSVGPEKTIDILGVQVKAAAITIKDVYDLNGSHSVTVILPSNTEAVWTSLGAAFQQLATKAYLAKRREIFDNEAGSYVFPRDITSLVTPKNTAIKPFKTTLIKQTINYGYAHTIHKSQGGTYTYVFVDEPSILAAQDSDTRKRLRYVAMTRAEKGAYILTASKVTGDAITEAKFPVATSVTDLTDGVPIKRSYDTTGEKESTKLNERARTETTVNSSETKDVADTNVTSDMTVFKSASGITYRVPAVLLNNKVNVKEFAQTILEVTSDSSMPAEDTRYIKELLKVFMAIKNDTVWIQLVTDLSSVTNADIRKKLPKSIGWASGKNLYFYLDTKTPVDILQVIAHEYHHVLTLQGLAENAKRNGDFKSRLSAVSSAVQEFAETNADVLTSVQKKRLQHTFSSNAEMLTIGFVEPDIASILANIKVGNTDAYSEVADITKAILAKDYAKTFPLVQETLNDLDYSRRRSATTGEGSSNQSSVNKGGETTDSPSTNLARDTVRKELDSTAGQAESTDLTQQESGKVSVLRSITPEERTQERNKPFHLRNLIKADFTQENTTNEANGRNPLVDVKDFILRSDLLTQVSEFLSVKTKVIAKQVEQLKQFQEFHALFKNSVQTLLAKTPKGTSVQDEDLVTYLMDDQGKLEENTLTAISLAAYSYLIQAGSKVYNTDEDLRAILRLEKDQSIPPEAASLLRAVGVEYPYAVKDMGAEISSTLRLKVMQDADPTLQDRLNTSFGLLAMVTLNDIGYVRIDDTSVNPAALSVAMATNGYTKQADGFNRMNKITFVRANFKTSKGKPVFTPEGKAVFEPLVFAGKQTKSNIESIVQANKETSGFLGKLFGVDVGYRTPETVAPDRFTQDKILRTKATVPDAQKELLNKAQQTVFTLKANTVKAIEVLKGLSDDSKFLKQLLGIWVDDSVLTHTHIRDRESLLAKTANEWKALENGLDWAATIKQDDGTYTGFYDTQTVSQNQRMSYASNLFNMQSSQIHRAMGTLAAYTHEVDLGNAQSLERFYQAVGEGLEGLDKYLKDYILASGKNYQFFTVDKVTGSDYVYALQQYLAEEQNQQAVAAMAKILEGNTPSEQDQAVIASFVDKGKMGIQSLQSLIALAEASTAVEGKFTTTIGLGSDGVNNGVATANVLTGIITRNMATKVGLLSRSDETAQEPESMQQVYERGSTDYYVDFGKAMRDALTEALDSAGRDTAWVKAITSLFSKYQEEVEGTENNPLAMRKIAKTWSIPFNYSAGKAALQRALGRGFLAGIYSEITDLGNAMLDLDPSSENFKLQQQAITFEARQLQDKLNTVLLEQGVAPVSFFKAGQLLPMNEQELTAAQEQALVDAMTQIHGNAAWEATETIAARYMEVRDAYVKIGTTAFALYNLAREELIKLKLSQSRERRKAEIVAKLEAAKAAGTIPNYSMRQVNKELDYFGLTSKELAEIDKILLPIAPTLHSPLSAESGKLASALSLSDRVTAMEEITTERRVRAKYPNRHSTGQGDMVIGLNKTSETDSGVKGLALAVQGMDAYVAAYLQAKFPTLNVHDAGIFGLDYFSEATKYQNETYLNGLTKYHFGLEYAESLLRSYKGLHQFMAGMVEYGINKEDQTAFANKVEELEHLLVNGVVKLNMWGQPYVAVQGLKHLSVFNDTRMRSMNDAIEAVADLAANNDTAKLDTTLASLANVHQYSGEGGVFPVPDTYAIEQLNKERDNIKQRKSLLVEQLSAVPTALDIENPSLVAFLESATKDGKMLTGKALAKALKTKDSASKEPMLQRQEAAILDAIIELIPDTVTVKYENFDEAGYGYFDSETDTIYIKPQGQKGSRVNSHLLIHELLHSAIAKRLVSIKQQPGRYVEAEGAYNRLEALRKEVIGKAGERYLILRDWQTDLSNQYQEAIASNDQRKVAEVKKTQAKVKQEMVSVVQALEAQGISPSVVMMLSSVDEFISYGLTDQTLQALLQGKATTAKPSLKAGWRVFVLAVMKLVGFRKSETFNAMSVFAIETANLLDAMKKEQVAPAKSTGILKQENFDEQVNNTSSLEVMLRLPHNNSAAFNNQLNSTILETIGQLYVHDDAARQRIGEVQTIASKAVEAGYHLSAKEAAVQQALSLCLDTYMQTNAGNLNVHKLMQVFQQAKTKLGVEAFHRGDWTTATRLEKQIAAQKHAFVFDTTKPGFITRFASMALASEEVHELLNVVQDSVTPSKRKSWFDTVNVWVRYALSWLTGKYIGLNAKDPLYRQIQHLVDNLTALDIRSRQETVAFYEKAWSAIGKVTTPLNQSAVKIRDAAAVAWLRNSKSLTLRALGAAATLDAKAMSETLPKLITDLRNESMPNTRLGEGMSILLEASTASEIRKQMEALIRQANSNARERQIVTDAVKRTVLSWFEGQGKALSKEQHRALSYVLLRTDLQALMATYSADQAIEFAITPAKRAAEISKLEAAVNAVPNGNDMLNAAKQLGYYMITGIGGEGLVKNATGIALGLGTQYQSQPGTENNALVADLDKLVSLYALEYTSSKDKQMLESMYAEHKEAFGSIVTLHHSLVKDAYQEFADNPLSYMKGWMPEITNPYKAVRFASTPQERDQLLKEGWKFISNLQNDPLDKTGQKFLMVHNDIGYQRLVSGAVDLENPARKGTQVISNTSPNYLKTVQTRYANSAKRAAIPHSQFDPSKQASGLIAVYDTDGAVLAYNYEMGADVRDTLLERGHNVAELFGAYAGASYYKPVKQQQSKVVAETLFADYKANYVKSPGAYLKLSPTSNDPEIVAMWRMLPHDFRKQATALYGKGEPIIIRNEAFTLAFGFKKWSLAKVFDKTFDQQNGLEKMFVSLARGLLGDSAQAKIAKAEHIWQDITKLVKDFIVIRSIEVLKDNIISNGFMLMAHDINPVQIAKDWTFAIANVRSYQTMYSELMQLKAGVSAGKWDTDIQQQMGLLQAQLDANPMKPYIDAGLLSSIVEDVALQGDDYSYKSAFKQRVDAATGWIPDMVKGAASWAILSPTTQGYQFLATTTQLSDFVAKFSLAKKLQSQGKSFDAAVSEASETFINYDVPTSVGMQYANDMGLFMFTKFFLRIQAVLAKLMDKRLASVLGQHIATEVFTDYQGILDQRAIFHVGNNPFATGAFGLPHAFGGIATVDMVF